MVPQVLGEPFAGQLAGDRERREDGVENRHIVAPAVQDEPERLELASEGALPRVERLELRPVADLADRVLGAGLGAVGRALVGDATAPGLHAIDPARHHLDEVQVPTPLEGQHGIGQAPSGVVHIGNVSPESHRQTIHRLSTESSQDALALCHRVGSLSFSSRGTFSTRYGLTVREGDAADAPQFLERLRAGDARAFEELVAAHQHRVFGVALRMLGNAAEAEEVAQDAFLRAHRNLSEFRGDAKLSTWLYAIASRLCLNRLAAAERRMIRQSDETLVRLPHRDAGPDAALERSELETALHRAIAELPDERRIVVVLRDLEGLSYEEIAEALGLELGTVRSRLHRARLDLKDKMERFLT